MEKEFTLAVTLSTKYQIQITAASRAEAIKKLKLMPPTAIRREGNFAETVMRVHQAGYDDSKQEGTP